MEFRWISHFRRFFARFSAQEAQEFGFSGRFCHTYRKYIFLAPLKVKFQTGDLIFENKQKATISKGPRFFWLALSCGAIDPIALLLLLAPLLILLLVFLLLFFRISAW